MSSVGFHWPDATPVLDDLVLPSYDALVSALSSYRGALLVASHDERFLEDIGVDRVVDLTGLAG